MRAMLAVGILLQFETINPKPDNLPDRPGRHGLDRLITSSPDFTERRTEALDIYLKDLCSCELSLLCGVVIHDIMTVASCALLLAGDAIVSRHDGLLRFLELHQCVKDITGQDHGFGDGSKRAALISSFKINGGEGPGGAGGSGIDVEKELAMEGITTKTGKHAIGHNKKALAKALEDEANAAIEAEMADRPDASPRPNNLDYHDGFRKVNSNMFLRRVGASLGVLDETLPSAISQQLAITARTPQSPGRSTARSPVTGRSVSPTLRVTTNQQDFATIMTKEPSLIPGLVN